ncbi:hypothetical protein QMZ05_37565 [Bradyrhizobium sp. INPA03-11B]|uniref:hypothetical protein n=1 Tax=Bradyrhizobium sp. INPA03-11B TaxID=418598 RepID=UPI00338F3A1D
MRPAASVIFLICAFVFASPKGASALDCAKAFWWNFDRSDGDQQRQRRDAEARATLANLAPLVFRGRIAWTRDLSDVRKTSTPVSLIVLKDVEVLRGKMPRSTRDRKAFIVFSRWCDTRCGSVSRWRPQGLTTFAAHRYTGGPVRSYDDPNGGKVLYNGRVDAVIGVCDPIQLTPLQEQLLNAPADEIARLVREYPFHPIRETQPANSD